MAEITPFTITTAGGKPTFASAAASDTAKCGPGYFLVVKNSDGSSHTVTIAVPGNTRYGQANPDPVYTVAATTGEEWIPLLEDYRDSSDGLAHLTWSATTGMTRAVVKR